MDLSEKHLSWITARALPVPEDLPEGEYPFDEAKAGEGTYYLTVRRRSVFPDLKSNTPEGVYMKSKGPVVPAQ